MKKIVLFLHGYGSNGNDLISLKDYISLEKEEKPKLFTLKNYFSANYFSEINFGTFEKK